jgi:hypothetical protein
MKSFALHFKKLFLVKYFLLGLSFAFIIHISGSCSKDSSSPVGPDNNNTNVDVTKINDGAKAVETAFLSGDPQQINNLLTENAKVGIGDEITNANTNDLIKLGEALKTRELDVYTDSYAEYSYTKDGVEYTIAFAHQLDDTWKLMRL